MIRIYFYASAQPRSAVIRRLTLPCVFNPVLLLLMLASCTTKPALEELRFREIIAGQIARYPNMQVEDLYKFIHQAAMGSEHAVRDTATARVWLEREIADLQEATHPEPILDTLSPDGRLVRVHLRTYLRDRGDPEALLMAFVRTANEYPGDTTTLARYWSYAERMAADGKLPYQAEDLRTFYSAMQLSGFPAVHHSEAYRNSYQPAYRVVAQDFLYIPEQQGGGDS